MLEYICTTTTTTTPHLSSPAPRAPQQLLTLSLLLLALPNNASHNLAHPAPPPLHLLVGLCPPHIRSAPPHVRSAPPRSLRSRPSRPIPQAQAYGIAHPTYTLDVKVLTPLPDVIRAAWSFSCAQPKFSVVEGCIKYTLLFGSLALCGWWYLNLRGLLRRDVLDYDGWGCSVLFDVRLRSEQRLVSALLLCLLLFNDPPFALTLLVPGWELPMITKLFQALFLAAALFFMIHVFERMQDDDDDDGGYGGYGGGHGGGRGGVRGAGEGDEGVAWDDEDARTTARTLCCEWAPKATLCGTIWVTCAIWLCYGRVRLARDPTFHLVEDYTAYAAAMCVLVSAGLLAGLWILYLSVRIGSSVCCGAAGPSRAITSIPLNALVARRRRFAFFCATSLVMLATLLAAVVLWSKGLAPIGAHNAALFHKSAADMAEITFFFTVALMCNAYVALVAAAFAPSHGSSGASHSGHGGGEGGGEGGGGGGGGGVSRLHSLPPHDDFSASDGEGAPLVGGGGGEGARGSDAFFSVRHGRPQVRRKGGIQVH